MAEQDMSQQGPQDSIGQRVADSQEQDPNATAQGNEQAQIASIISDLDRRLRTLEERYGNLRKKINLTDQNIIETDKSFGKSLRNFDDEILDVKRNISDFEEKTVMFKGELENVAQKSDLKVVEKYLAMWNPGMFVTRKELREYLKDRNIQVLNDDGKESEDK